MIGDLPGLKSTNSNVTPGMVKLNEYVEMSNRANQSFTRVVLSYSCTPSSIGCFDTGSM